MKDERGSWSLPVLLGMALSLLVLFLVVSPSYAETLCAGCLRNARIKAQILCGGTAPMIDPKTRQPTCYFMQLKHFEQVDCYDTKICPDGGTITGSADCGSTDCRFLMLTEGNCGDGADPGAGTICSNECWGKSCNGSTGTCLDVYAYAPPNKPSVCYVQCGCKQ